MVYPLQSNKEMPDRPCRKQANPEVGDIFRHYIKAYCQSHSLPQKALSVIDAIKQCRTSALGYHLDECDECGYKEPSPNSCRDRHCPTCQGINRRKWVKARLEDLLPVPYYHVVFTLPHLLFPLSLYNKELIYNLLFDNASATLLELGKDPHWLGGEIGFYGILHTWGQTLWHHVHVHFIVPGGALKADGRWVKSKYRGRFLFPVAALSKVFRGKFVEGLKAAYDAKEIHIPEEMDYLDQEDGFELWVNNLVARDWVVYCKAPLGRAEEVVKYIGHYSHRVAISNNRLISIDKGEIRFRYKDYKDEGILWKETVLKAHDFIQRFLWHVLPEGFHKIRHYGFLANGKSKAKIAKIRERVKDKCNDTREKTAEERYGHLCPKCKKGRLNSTLIINRFGHIIITNMRLLKGGYVFNTT